MTQPSSFTIPVLVGNKYLKICTASPNGKFYYRIKEPRDLYWGLLCSKIAFYDIEGNLVYHNPPQYVQFRSTETMEWKLVSWSSDGTFALFIERNSPKSLRYVLLDLPNRKVCKTEYNDSERDRWKGELFGRLPKDMAEAAYYKIVSTADRKSVFDYVLSLDLIDDKTELIAGLQQYYSDFENRVGQLEAGNFDEKIIVSCGFDKFEPIKTSKTQKNILEIIGIDQWRP